MEWGMLSRLFGCPGLQPAGWQQHNCSPAGAAFGAALQRGMLDRTCGQ